jgi:hypothetical protein
VGLTVGAGAQYALFQSATTGLSFQVSADVGVLSKKLVYALLGGVSMSFGHSESYYVAPGGLGDALPFDLPLPAIVTGVRP